jgi:hypothetical protein
VYEAQPEKYLRDRYKYRIQNYENKYKYQTRYREGGWVEKNTRAS